MLIKDLIVEDSYYHFYQPIVNIELNKIIGYEGLMRSAVHSNPEQIFLQAKREKQLVELDSRSIQKATKAYQKAGYRIQDGCLFLNVFPTTLLDSKFPLFTKEIMLDDPQHCQHLVFEISELEDIREHSQLIERIMILKEMGFKFAIDDVGKGYSDFQTIIEMEPDYIKVDRYFSQQLSQFPKKQSFIQLVNEYSKRNGCQLILEGLETVEDLEVARQLGVEYAQGYLLGRPEPLRQIS
ncbi:EAL domain-containing protein (putative c-di-GMP-specific phosphodiesterase class I) [Metabacillus crassostreae]|uniref:EAL domain-containing protein n=1 Tax=Metabacillus crassostreae TaxID=929098 RepID=UPI00195A15CA|nr:EAL domain-containing protein [Metabacillus crassostreae]MBM7606365.1 EAL domain-containing protein (putative c-di-GMP-specific phosphodiesterase class I) [Metabacillus crassostreae]